MGLIIMIHKPAPPRLFPDTLDALLDERRHAYREAVRATDKERMMRFLRLVHRYTVRIDRRLRSS